MSTEPKTIVSLANSEKLGGGNQVLISLIKGLDHRKFRPFLVSPRPGALTEWATNNGVGWASLPLDGGGGRLDLVKRVASLAWIFARQRASLVHAHSPWAYRAAGLAARLTGTKGVCHVHFPLGARDLAWNTRFGVDAVVTCYERLADELRRELPGDEGRRLVAIRNTVDERKFTPVGDQAARERWRGGADHVIVTVGHLSEVKGYPTFLEAAARIKQERPNSRFLAVGGETLTPGYGATLNEMTRSLGLERDVEFLGWRNDVPDVLRAADVMVLPSLAEGLPLAVLEAMACGLPVVATDVNGTPEAVIDGETGLLIKPNDAAGLAAKVMTLLANPSLRQQMGEAARHRIESHFTMKQYIPQVEALYDRLIAARGC